MAQTGYTPIQIYQSSTAANVPLAVNLLAGELAINTADGKLFYKDSGGVVQTMATKGTALIGGSNTQIQYNNAGTVAGSANLTFNGTVLTVSSTVSATNLTGTLTTAAQPNITSTGTLSSLTVSGIANLNAIANVRVSGGTNGQVIKTDGAGNLSFVSAGTVTSVTGTAPVVSSGGATPAISMAAATTSVSGYLTSTDWNTFNGKQAALGYTPLNSTTPVVQYLALTGDMNNYTVSTFNSSGYGSDSTSNLPVSPSGTAAWWNTLTVGISSRISQLAMQAFGTGSGTAPQNAIYLRSKHDTGWSAWTQVWTATSLPAASSGVNGYMTGAFATTLTNATNAATASTLMLRDGSGDVSVRYLFSSYLNMSHGASGSTTDTIFYSSNDDYIRKNNATGFKTSLGIQNVTNESKATMFTSPTFTGSTTTGDVTSYRVAAVTTGYHYFGNTGTKYIGFDGTNFVTTMPMNFSILGNSATTTLASALTGSVNSIASSGNWNTDFQNTTAYTSKYYGDSASGTNSPGLTWWFQQNYRHSNPGNYWGIQVAWGWEDNANKLATRNVTSGTFGAWVYYLNTSGQTFTGSLTMSGNITAYSDERLKKDWVLLPTSFIESLSKVKVGTYSRTDIEQRQIGISAQNLQDIIPEAVLEDKDGMLSVAYGNAALAACVELAKEVMELRKRLSILENK